MSVNKETKVVLDQVMKDKSTQTTSKASNNFRGVPNFQRKRNYWLDLPTQRNSGYVQTVRVPPPSPAKIDANTDIDFHREVSRIDGLAVTREDLMSYYHEDDGMSLTCKKCRFTWDGLAQHQCTKTL